MSDRHPQKRAGARIIELEIDAAPVLFPVAIAGGIRRRSLRGQRILRGPDRHGRLLRGRGRRRGFDVGGGFGSGHKALEA